MWIAYGMAGLVVCIRWNQNTRNGFKVQTWPGRRGTRNSYFTLYRLYTSAHDASHRRSPAIHSVERPTATPVSATPYTSWLRDLAISFVTDAADPRGLSSRCLS